MTFNARTWDSDAANVPLMSTLETEVAQNAYYMEAARNLGINLASIRIDEPSFTVSGGNINAFMGGTLPGDLTGGGFASTMQLRACLGFRVSVWGTSTAASAGITVNVFRSVTTLAMVNANTGTIAPAGGAGAMAFYDSGWLDMASAAAASWDLVARASWTTAKPTFQWWGSVFYRSRP